MCFEMLDWTICIDLDSLAARALRRDLLAAVAMCCEADFDAPILERATLLNVSVSHACNVLESCGWVPFCEREVIAKHVPSDEMGPCFHSCDPPSTKDSILFAQIKFLVAHPDQPHYVELDDTDRRAKIDVYSFEDVPGPWCGEKDAWNDLHAEHAQRSGRFYFIVRLLALRTGCE
ncbi:hypothetical protein DFH08DRAFT_806006 [Mycena albidolilacea]|uniref:Uncharacterized protein n=1 Tax=Mycena albidolilacea TaxID=1033008 RepID=A0AAD7EVD1_9AGAR|nr:hypothetical protein DFH08DRAFT_806006 [Mycena albidolilacea]